MSSRAKVQRGPISVPHKINNLTVLPVTLPSTSAYPFSVAHYLYIRPDAPNDAAEVSPDNHRSLFIANIPIASTESSFRAFFKTLSAAALVDRVEFADEGKRKTRLAVTGDVIVQGTKIGVPIGVLRGKKRKRNGGDDDELVKRKLENMELPSTWDRGVWESGSAAVVVFVDRAAMTAAWNAAQKVVKHGRRAQWLDDGEGLGLERYSTHKSLSYPSVTVLQSKVNAYLTHFSALESLRNKQLAKQRNIPDDEGFVTVTRGGRTGAGRVEDAQAAQVRLKEREGRRVGSDFYRFQTREEKKKREHDLKKKFEEDRRRVEVLRGRRGRVVPE